MVNVTMDQIIAFRNAGDLFGDYKLPLKVAYKLNKLKKAIEVEGEFYRNKFQEIVDTYAKKDENEQVIFSDDGNQIIIQDGMVEECNKALNDLQTLEVQIETYGLSIDDFGEDLECTPDQLAALMPFME